MAGSSVRKDSRSAGVRGLLLPVLVGLLCVLSLIVGLNRISSVCLVEAEGPGDPVVSETVEVRLKNRTVTCNVVRVALADPRVRVGVGLGQDRVGLTEDLLSLARRKGAVAAINGTFFNAYEKGRFKDPVGTIFSDGEIVHKGNTGTVFAITWDKRTTMEPLRLKIVGGIDGSEVWPNNWYAYFINRTPTSSNSVIVYNRWRGETTGVSDGISVVVDDFKVVRIGSGEQEIPESGFVANFRGSEEPLAQRFYVGAGAYLRFDIEYSDSPVEFWLDVADGIGAGPRLVKDGSIVFSVEAAKAEGFTEAKILTQSNARSALGITESGDLLLVTVPGANMAELAEIMKPLGAVDAMNLDGGASSGLVYKNSYITRPGRDISNALLVYIDE